MPNRSLVQREYKTGFSHICNLFNPFFSFPNFQCSIFVLCRLYLLLLQQLWVVGIWALIYHLFFCLKAIVCTPVWLLIKVNKPVFAKGLEMFYGIWYVLWILWFVIQKREIGIEYSEFLCELRCKWNKSVVYSEFLCGLWCKWNKNAYFCEFCCRNV